MGRLSSQAGSGSSVVKVLSSPLDSWDADGPSAVTIGVLDGVHFGHRELLARLDESLATTVLTFEPHPVEVLRPGTDPRLITDIDERLRLLERAGIRQVGVLDLAEIKELGPEEFVADVLVERLDVSHVVVGFDFRFGKNRAGDAGLLRQLGMRHGFEVETVGLVGTEGRPANSATPAVSSSRIRREIESGRFGAVADLMPVRFQVANEVVEGDRRGRKLGFPTANLDPPDRKVAPAIGVYAAFTHTPGGVHQSAVNVGVRPTFGSGGLVIESYILDFDADLYGQTLTVEFVEYLRPEIKFDDVDALVAQMHLDVERASQVLSATDPTVS